MDTVQKHFVDALAEHSIVLTDDQLQQFEQYYKLLVEWNERMNLTAITERDQVYEKHFYDSLTLSFYTDMKQVKTLADIGSGAGFPAIPLRIVFPHVHITIVDSLNKRIQFLNHVVKELDLAHVETVHARAEDAGRDPKLRDSFDLVTARAVARLVVLNELCLPFVKPDGLFAAMKASDANEELEEARFSFGALQAKVAQIESFQLTAEQAKRTIIMARKTGATPKKYPRKAGMPSKMPLLGF
ncbi:16S rRNA (guanine(527)-N(7))-methyltransferase RsmG [Xylanibacillus composti]|nr:16S rRNA (guanine(527)-N(7))-methyltransferase RsmG [Xylanibacillus composti]MDT9725190.1 16S rRNA (guanine(527)-N(7))-methyltransferase RsmG [Xylanibacillus composti]